MYRDWSGFELFYIEILKCASLGGLQQIAHRFETFLRHPPARGAEALHPAGGAGPRGRAGHPRPVRLPEAVLGPRPAARRRGRPRQAELRAGGGGPRVRAGWPSPSRAPRRGRAAGEAGARPRPVGGRRDRRAAGLALLQPGPRPRRDRPLPGDRRRPRRAQGAGTTGSNLWEDVPDGVRPSLARFRAARPAARRGLERQRHAAAALSTGWSWPRPSTRSWTRRWRESRSRTRGSSCSPSSASGRPRRRPCTSGTSTTWTWSGPGRPGSGPSCWTRPGLYPDADCPRVRSLAELAGHLDPPGGARRHFC